MANEGKDLLELKQALRAGEKLSNAQVVKLAGLRRAANAGRRHVEVHKLQLREGEELMDFVWAMMDAVQTNRVILADGSLDAWLEGIFEDHVIVRDGNTGRTFQANFTRSADGEIVFEEPFEVRAVFVPVNAPEEDAVERAVRKRAPEPGKLVEVTKAIERKWGFLPTSLSDRR